MATQPLQVGILGTGDRVFLVSFTVTASAAASAIFTGTIYPYGIDDGTTFTAFQIPTGVIYHLVDITVSSSPTTEGQLTFYVNGNKQGENFFLADLVSTNSARVKPQLPITLAAGATFTVKLTLLVAGPTNQYLQYLKVYFVATPA